MIQFCDCGTHDFRKLNRIDGVMVCGDCALPIMCEFSGWKGDNDPPPHPATDTHIDYIVCSNHMDYAVDNVSCRYE